MKNLPRMMSEPGQMYAIFLARNGLGRFPLLDVEDLDHLIVPRRNQIVALVVKVKRCNIDLLVRLWIASECL